MRTVPAAPRRLLGGLRQFALGVSELGPFDLAARLTLVYFMVRPLGPWWAQVPAVLVASGGLLLPALTRRPSVWFVLTLAVAAWVLSTWAIMDNHGFLLIYWCLALFCSLVWSDRPDEALAANARWLIGAVFGLSVLWKLVLSPDFIAGDFFRVIFLVDPRFRNLSLLAGGMSPASYSQNSLRLQQLGLGRLGLTAVRLAEPHRQVVLAYVVTWWTAIVETTVAAAFLLPRRWRLHRLRDGALIFFCWLTYPFASVVGFGWLLTVMGLAQVERDRRWTRLLYLVTFALILVDKLVPWTHALLGFVQ